MAIPKKLREIPKEKAERLISKHLKAGTGEWEGSPFESDFVYSVGDRGLYKMYLIRPMITIKFETGHSTCFSNYSYETGKVSL